MPDTSLASYSSTYEFGLELYFKLSAPLYWTPCPPACRSHGMTLFIGQNRLWRTAGWKLCILWNFTELCHGPSVSSNCHFPSFTNVTYLRPAAISRSTASLICAQSASQPNVSGPSQTSVVPAQCQRSQSNVSSPNPISAVPALSPVGTAQLESLRPSLPAVRHTRLHVGPSRAGPT